MNELAHFLDDTHLGQVRKFINSFTSIPEEEWLYFKKLIRVKKFLKGEKFFSQGEIVQDIGFIAKGILRNFYETNSGGQWIKCFLSEGQLVSSYASMLQERNSSFSSEAVEDSVLYLLNFYEFESLYTRHPSWQIFGRKMAEQLFLKREKREYQMLVLDPQEKYEAFLLDFAHLHHRLPQYLVAQYLGLTPVGLSRIKKRILR